MGYHHTRLANGPITNCNTLDVLELRHFSPWRSRAASQRLQVTNNTTEIGLTHLPSDVFYRSSGCSKNSNRLKFQMRWAGWWLSLKMEEVRVSNLEELLMKIGSRKEKGGRIFLLFCGDIDDATGVSWCPDCVKGKRAPILIHTLMCIMIVQKSIIDTTSSSCSAVRPCTRPLTAGYKYYDWLTMFLTTHLQSFEARN